MANLVILNPNTDDSLTQRLVQKAASLWSGGTVRGVTARLGAPYIDSRVTHAVAEYAVVEIGERLSLHKDDRILVACFGDPGVKALRELTANPVMGMAYGAVLACAMQGEKIGIITGGMAWKAMIEEFLRAEELTHHVAAVGVTELSGAVGFSEKDRVIEAVLRTANDLIDNKNIRSILIAGAGFSDIKKDIEQKLSVPVYCSLEESVKFFNKQP